MMHEDFAIEATGICFSYQEGSQALTDVDFRVRRGEFVAMLASNGSGKTTLIRVIAGLIKPQKGKVRIFDRDIGSIDQADLYQQVGLVFQNPNDQLFASTVEEDVAFAPRNLGLPEAEVVQRVTEALESVAANHLRDRAIHHLSFGEQKRVAMAGVLAMRPSILILDEPTAGLDPAGEELMMRLLRKLNRRGGLTVILATHSVDLLPLFADIIYALNRGVVLCQGPAADVFGDHEMLSQACLRLPYISTLLLEMKKYDGVPINGLPLTVGDARQRLLELIPAELIVKQMGGAAK